MDYFEKRNEYKALAIEHTKEMEAKYGEEISRCAKNSKIYREIVPNVPSNSVIPVVRVVNATSVDAAFRYGAGKTCILNFASYKNPGGMFIEGSSAQEESLCHASFLYNVLSERKDYYEWNANRTEKGMYTDSALYSPNVKFFNGNRTQKFDVLTCAAPNLRKRQVSYVHNTDVLQHRAKFVCDIISAEHAQTAILGAWGCGVFLQNPVEVAEIFKNLIENYALGCTKVIMAINGGKNLAAFKDAFASMSI